ncbi:unnamed protein product [Hermetia illucens]|uniref:Lipase domain-containing protein n=1 Tax=Hermetia illucens TaxID=343691 RepID=A0A7R8YX74_HERIL|nr:unnamed protein product [Hermetia illucens]
MPQVFVYSGFNVLFTLTLWSVVSVPVLGSVEVVAQYPNDLQTFDDDNEGNNETLIIRKGYDTLEQAVFFKFYKNGQLTYIANGINVEQLGDTGCTPDDRFAFLLHGWRESCDVDWMKLLIAKLTAHRGGCIVCIDYGALAQEAYVRLLRKFGPLTDIMTNKLKYMYLQGLNPDKTFMFGFSFGGQLSTAIGNTFGPNQIKEIDTCDMAGPGFDFRVASLDHKDAAQNVQCIHTSRDKGTKNYDCHQDWRMGNCGASQDAADRPPMGSHGLCPYFYISAFDHPFFAVNQPRRCSSSRPASFWPEDFKMGYLETRKPMVSGELFAITSNTYPFNIEAGSKYYKKSETSSTSTEKCLRTKFTLIKTENSFFPNS